MNAKIFEANVWNDYSIDGERICRANHCRRHCLLLFTFFDLCWPRQLDEYVMKNIYALSSRSRSSRLARPLLVAVLPAKLLRAGANELITLFQLAGNVWLVQPAPPMQLFDDEINKSTIWRLVASALSEISPQDAVISFECFIVDWLPIDSTTFNCPYR